MILSLPYFKHLNVNQLDDNYRFIYVYKQIKPNNTILENWRNTFVTGWPPISIITTKTCSINYMTMTFLTVLWTRWRTMLRIISWCWTTLWKQFFNTTCYRYSNAIFETKYVEIDKNIEILQNMIRVHVIVLIWRNVP